MSAKVERLRDFIGLEANNMMRIVSAASNIINPKAPTPTRRRMWNLFTRGWWSTFVGARFTAQTSKRWKGT